MRFLATISEEGLLPFSELSKGLSFKGTIEDLTKKAVALAMHKTRGNRVHAAKMLGINRNTLSHYFKKLSAAERRKVFQYDPET